MRLAKILSQVDEFLSDFKFLIVWNFWFPLDQHFLQLLSSRYFMLETQAMLKLIFSAYLIVNIRFKRPLWDFLMTKLNVDWLAGHVTKKTFKPKICQKYSKYACTVMYTNINCFYCIVSIQNIFITEAYSTTRARQHMFLFRTQKYCAVQ